jgi:hypothetical protein
MERTVLTESTRLSLLRVLLADEDGARASADRLSHSNGWSAAFKTAEAWSVAPQLAERVRQLVLQPPPAEWQEFKQVVIASYARSASRASRGIAAIRQLENCGVSTVAFKGLASMARLYTPPANRTIKDADVLIEKSNLSTAIECLGSIGLVPLEGHNPETLDRFMDDSPGFSGNRAIVLYGPDDFEIDLHWGVGLAGLNPDALLQRSSAVTLFARSVPVVDAGDGMILTARHAIRENLSIDTMCRDLFDIRQSCAFMASHGQLVTALERATIVNNLVPLLALIEILGALDATNRDAMTASKVLTGIADPDQLKAAAQLRTLFFQQVTAGPIGKDLLYLFHSRPARQILSGVFANWREYRSVMRSMEQKLEGEEIPIGRRLWQLALAVRSTGPAHLRSIRTLARFKYGT